MIPPTATHHSLNLDTPFHIPEGSGYYNYPTKPIRSQSDQEQAYRAALELIARIDENLTLGTGHYRTKAGRLLTCLDEVVITIIAGNLAGVE